MNYRKINQKLFLLLLYIITAPFIITLIIPITIHIMMKTRKKDFQSFKDPVKHVIYGEKSIETLYNLLVFFQEKGYIE